MWTEWWRGLCKCKTVGDVHSKFWISSPVQQNISSFFWVAVAVVQVVVVTHANHTLNYKYGNKSITALKDDAHSPASVYWCRTLSAFWFSLARFEKCNVNSPDSSVYLEKLLFECKIHCKTLPFKRTKTKSVKKFAGSRQKRPQSACFSNGLQQQPIWINLGQFPKAAMNTEMCGLNWMTLRLKCEDDGRSKLKKHLFR